MTGRQVRKRRRFPVSHFQATSTHWAENYGLTPEAADVVTSIHNADGKDLEAAILVLSAYDEAMEAGNGRTTPKEIKDRLTTLRRQRTMISTADFWAMFSRQAKAIEGEQP